MKEHQPPTNHIITIIESLPPDLQAEIGHYADFVRTRYLQSKDAKNTCGEWTGDEITRASSESLWRIWDNDEDAVYDKL